MMRMMGIAAFMIGSVACSSSTDGDAPAFKCALGELRGTWRLTYAEKDGTCGQLAAETVVLTGESSAPSGCQQNALVVSTDKCRMDLDFTCPTASGGTQQWVGVTRHVADDRLVSDMTAEAHVGGQSCRSTYEITWTRQ